VVRVDGYNLVNVLLAKPESFIAYPANGDAICKYPDVVERDGPTRSERVDHRRGILGFYADDPDPGTHQLDVNADSGDQAATPDGHEERIDIISGLFQYLGRDGSLARYDVRVVERMDKDETTLTFEHTGVVVGIIVGVTVENDLAAECAYGIDLDGWCGDRHDDRGGNTTFSCSQRNALSMVPG
jgi:hypothetical protein